MSLLQIKTFATRDQIATSIAILFHAIGLIGILYFDKDFFISTTPFHLLLMFLLLLFTQRQINKGMLLFAALCIFSGIAVEIIGTKTGSLFGQYAYGTVLGPSFQGVPLIIGINWFIIIYCVGIAIHTLLMRIITRLNAAGTVSPTTLKALSVIIDGATLATMFDWLMEPVAIKLVYWKWGGTGDIPFYNYICWFGISALLLAVFHYTPFNKQNKFAVNLLLIQAMFFLLLRTFL